MIKYIQFDPFSFCNAKCWFCPRGYYDNPKEFIKHTKSDEIDIFFKMITDNVGDLISPHFEIYSAHYNEIFLYKNLEYYFRKLREYNFKIFLLSNGTTITPKTIELIKNYPDVISGILFNVPGSTPESWSKYTKLPEKLFPKMINSINEIYEIIPKKISIVVNGWDKNSKTTKLLNQKYITSNPIRESKELTKLFDDKIKVCPNNALVDRSGILRDLKIISNEIPNRNNRKITKCEQGRLTNWLHISSNLDVFLCCNDYFFDTIIGNIKNNTLKEIWFSDKKKETIKKMREKDGLCYSCFNAL